MSPSACLLSCPAAAAEGLPWRVSGGWDIIRNRPCVTEEASLLGEQTRLPGENPSEQLPEEADQNHLEPETVSPGDGGPDLPIVDAGGITDVPADAPAVSEQLSEPSPGESVSGETPRSQSNLRPLLIEILQTVLLTLLIFAAVRSVVQNFKVDGASMEPTLYSGQYLLINKLAYARVDGIPLRIVQGLGIHDDSSAVYPFGRPELGDIVVFRYPGRPDRDFIKRVIAVPGDQIHVDRGQVYVNGVRLEEDYIRALPSYSLAPQQVPEGNYFVLGDNRPNSSDSHIWGFVPEDNLIGKAWLTYWPPNQWGLVASSGIAGN